MQYLKLSYELIEDKNINVYEFRIYAYLLSRYNEKEGKSYPSYEKISEKTNIGLTTVKKAIKHLVELGYMIIEKAKSVKGNYNVYKKLKHLIQDHQEPKAAANEELKVAKKNNTFNKSYKTNKKVLKFNSYAQRNYSNEEYDSLLGWD